MLPKGALKGRPIPSAASEVSQPGLLLPMQAAHSKGRDTADVVEFHVAMGATRRATLTPLTVSVVSKHCDSLLENYCLQLSGLVCMLIPAMYLCIVAGIF